MAKRKYIVLSLERLDPEHPLGPLVPMGRFDWERILGRCMLKPTSIKLIGYILATYADLESGDRIFPGNKRIGAVAGASRSTVERGLEILGDAGLIHQLSSGSSYGRGAKASEYRLTAPLILAEAYRDEWNEKEWDEMDPWLISEVLEQLGSSRETPANHASPLKHDPQEHASPVAHDPDGPGKEHASISKEHASPLNRTCVTSEDPSTYTSSQQSMNHHHLASRNKGNPATDLLNAANDESETSIEEAYQQAYAKLSALPDNGVELMAKVEADQPELNLRQRVITAAERAPKRRGKNAA